MTREEKIDIIVDFVTEKKAVEFHNVLGYEVTMISMGDPQFNISVCKSIDPADLENISLEDLEMGIGIPEAEEFEVIWKWFSEDQLDEIVEIINE